MRSTLELSDKQDISIAKELEAVQLYLGLEKLRFEDQFDYEIVIDPSLKINEYRIPNMLIQPYVENAVKHGIKTENGKGFISVKLKKINSEIEYTIEDNGIGISKSFAKKENNHENQKSRGMEITRNRLQLLANNQSDSNNIEILDLNDLDPDKTGTRITIKLPIINLN